MVVDIVEGQGRREALKMAKIHHGVKTRHLFEKAKSSSRDMRAKKVGTPRSLCALTGVFLWNFGGVFDAFFEILVFIFLTSLWSK